MAEEYYFCGEEKIVLKKSTTHTAYKKEIPPEPVVAGPEQELPMITNASKKDKRDKKGGVKLVKVPLEDAGDPIDEENEELKVYEENSGKSVLTYEFIVKFKEDAAEEKINEIINDPKFEFKKRTYDKNLYLGIIKNKEDYKNILKIIGAINAKKDFVEYAHPNFKSITKLLSFPNDGRFSEQWALNQAGVDINVQPVWASGIKGQGIKIAIVDVGVAVDHEDLMTNGQPVKGFDTINDEAEPSPVNEDSHGTKCAGVAAAKGNNNQIGICGVAPESEIIAIRIAREEGDGWVTDADEIAQGISKAIELGADVISNSWYYNSRNPTIINALRKARSPEGRNGKGCIVVFAAGNYDNEEGDGDMSVSYPANQSNLVIAVGAYNKSGNWVGDGDDEGWSSRHGAGLKICAPGFDILTTNYYSGNGNGELKYDLFSGTSAAAPMVAGVAALILNANGNLTAVEVEKILLETADKMMNDDPDNKTGHGKVNAKRAVDRALGI